MGEPARPLAFPQPNCGDYPNDDSHRGMTLRDFFAAAALTGQLHNDAFSPHDFVSPDLIARRAYEYADAMLKERAKGEA